MNTSAGTTANRRMLNSHAEEENLNLPQPGVCDRDIDDSTLAVENNPFKNYANNPFMLAELIFCTFFLAISPFAFVLFQRQVYEREIPYQMTQNGDFLFDQYINRPFSENETIPLWLLMVITFILPTLIIIVTGVMSNTKNDGHSGICSLFFALGSNLFITSFVKLYCGYFRPNFYSYCDFSEDTFTCNSDSTNPRESFPSGHASLSFCAMTVLTLFFYGKIGLHRGLSPHLREEQRNAKNYYKKRIFSMVAALPMLLAVFIAASRVHDDSHHPADVVGGAIIGLSTAIFGYGLWYPSIYSQFAGCPLQTAFNEFEER